MERDYTPLMVTILFKNKIWGNLCGHWDDL